ncbi:MAG: hypothetical protein LBP50_03190 [Tannerella sp.]|nr:hypothetical protein [Tannerella sp.]
MKIGPVCVIGVLFLPSTLNNRRPTPNAPKQVMPKFGAASAYTPAGDKKASSPLCCASGMAWISASLSRRAGALV